MCNFTWSEGSNPTAAAAQVLFSTLSCVCVCVLIALLKAVPAGLLGCLSALNYSMLVKQLQVEKGPLSATPPQMKPQRRRQRPLSFFFSFCFCWMHRAALAEMKPKAYWMIFIMAARRHGPEQSQNGRPVNLETLETETMTPTNLGH